MHLLFSFEVICFTLSFLLTRSLTCVSFCTHSLKSTRLRHIHHHAMSYNRRRHETLRRLGIEQLPILRYHNTPEEPRSRFGFDLPVRTMPASPSAIYVGWVDANDPHRCLATDAPHAQPKDRQSGSFRERGVHNAAHKSTEAPEAVSTCTAHDHSDVSTPHASDRSAEWSCRRLRQLE